METILEEIERSYTDKGNSVSFYSLSDFSKLLSLFSFVIYAFPFFSERADGTSEKIREDVTRLGKIWNLGVESLRKLRGKTQSLSPESGQVLLSSVCDFLLIATVSSDSPSHHHYTVFSSRSHFNLFLLFSGV